MERQLIFYMINYITRKVSVSRGQQMDTANNVQAVFEPIETKFLGVFYVESVTVDETWMHYYTPHIRDQATVKAIDFCR